MPVLSMQVVSAQDHPDADTLRVYDLSAEDILIQVIANNSTVYSVGDVVACATIGTVLADGTQVRKNKFRGVRSYGIILGRTDRGVGEDLTYSFSASVKDKVVDGSTGVVEESAWVKYTSIEGYLKLKEDILAVPEVIVTEKIHGSSARFGFKGQKYLIGTHTSRVLPDRVGSETWPSGHLLAHFTRWCKENNIESRVMSWRDSHPEVLQMGVFGELMGFKCSDLHYGEEAQQVKLFGEIQVNGRYLDYDEALKIIQELFPNQDLSSLMVPILYRGKPDHETLRKIRDMPSASAKVNGSDQISEGIVIRPSKEVFSEISKDRLIAKWKGPLYAERKSLRDLDPEILPDYLSAHDLIFDFVTAERIRHVCSEASLNGVQLISNNIPRIAELLLADIIKESKGEWSLAPMDRRVLIRWTKTIASDLIAMVIQDTQMGVN